MVVFVYMFYLLASVVITLWVGHTLHRNGRVFLAQNFNGNEALADSVNHLLLVGFYLVNLGFISLALRYGVKPLNLEEGIEFLSTKIGLVIMVLGAMHFFNIRTLVKFRNFKWAVPAPAAE